MSLQKYRLFHKIRYLCTIKKAIMNEIIFLVEEALEGGFTAKALECSIFTEGDSYVELKKNIRDAVLCHFEVAGLNM